MCTIQVINILPVRIRKIILQLSNADKLTEIRLRTDRPLIYYIDGREFVTKVYVTNDEICECMEYISRYSLYAYENELKNGYITIAGGHRVGVCATFMEKDGAKAGIRDITSVNIRVAREVTGIADEVLKLLFDKDNFLNTLVVSPPGCGKTTLLRELIRNISDSCKNVSVIDERGEISGVDNCTINFDLGIRTDVFAYCTKAYGISMAIRSMKPEVIAVDEIGGADDVMALEKASVSGVGIIASLHSSDISELRSIPNVGEMIERGYFKRIIVLKAGEVGIIEGVYNSKGEVLQYD